MWSLSRAARNKAVYVVLGNPSRLTPTMKAVMFTAWRARRGGPEYGIITDVIEGCYEVLNERPGRRVVAQWIAKWTANDGEFSTDERSRNQKRSRVLSPLGVSQLQNACLGPNYDDGKENVQVGRTTVRRWSRDAEQELSYPTVTSIAKHSVHHARMRVFTVKQLLTHYPEWLLSIRTTSPKKTTTDKQTLSY